MSEDSTRLLSEIISEIETSGPLPFARFMEGCLYHPRYGYYTRGLGGGGGRDYVTSSGTHRAFGILLARQALEMWRRLDRPRRFTFVEFGPGEGLFAADFLGEAGRSEQFTRSLEYVLVEPSPVLRERQRRRLIGRTSIPLAWAAEEDLESRVESLEGCLFANEVLDAFPVHRVIRTRDGFREVHVTARDRRLTEVLERVSTEEIERSIRHLEGSGIVLEEGQEVDLNLAAPRWAARAVRTLRRGYLVVIDYGSEARGLYDPGRRRGTILAYHRHRAGEDFLARPGEQDLTAHVDFSALVDAAEGAGARRLGLVTQARFLLALGALEFLVDPLERKSADGEGAVAEALHEREALLDLVLPGRMGERFRVLVLGVGGAPGELSGLAAPWRERSETGEDAPECLSVSGSGPMLGQAATGDARRKGS